MESTRSCTVPRCRFNLLWAPVHPRDKPRTRLGFSATPKISLRGLLERLVGLGIEKHRISLKFPLAPTGKTTHDAKALHLENVQSTGRRLCRAMAGALLGLLLALHAAAAIPALHHFLHGDDSDSECHEPDCVVLAYASGSIDPGPTLGAVIRPDLLEARAAVSNLGSVIDGYDYAQPPGRGPPTL